MIQASDVKELREITNVGMMECKKALLEANGNKEEAIKILKEKGLAISAKRSSKETNEGIVFIEHQSNKVWMIKICCETDFVAKNEDFLGFVEMVGSRFVAEGEALIEKEEFKTLVSETVARTGEKIEVVDPVIIESDELIETYIHANKKIGVIVVLAISDSSTYTRKEIKDLAKDLCLQIAAMDPVAVSIDEVSEVVKQDQKEIFLKQMESDPKPIDIKEKIISGKLNKYFSEKCLLEMEFVKGSGSVRDHIAMVGKEMGVDISIRKFKRLQIGN